MKAFIKSFVFAFKGWRAFVRDQRNLGVQLGIASLTVAAGFYFGITPQEWYAILLCIALVLSLEMINTAIENLVNMITRDHDPLAGKVKDIAAGAVTFACIMAVIIGIIVFWKYFVNAIEGWSLTGVR